MLRVSSTSDEEDGGRPDLLWLLIAVRVCPERLTTVPMLDDRLTICCSMAHISAAEGTMPLAPFSALHVVNVCAFVCDRRNLTVRSRRG